MSEQIPAEELFHNYYHYFLQSLARLAESAEDQCASGNNFNVAWELQDDLLRDASGVLIYQGSGLSAEQRADIVTLVEELKALPTSVLSGSRNAAGSLRDMNHPCWSPLRGAASALIKTLEPITNQNRAYFHESKP